MARIALLLVLACGCRQPQRVDVEVRVASLTPPATADVRVTILR